MWRVSKRQWQPLAAVIEAGTTQKHQYAEKCKKRRGNYKTYYKMLYKTTPATSTAWPAAHLAPTSTLHEARQARQEEVPVCLGKLLLPGWRLGQVPLADVVGQQ
jgi:hypothetical protein